jgi:NADH:ubiquinone oxidoreductase subunit 5 (chain L)/Multisubunit Na+/H+ antiporter, MnhA subunit
MLAGGLANCGLLGLIRMFQICSASGDTEFYRTIMVGMGLFSLAVAAIFLLRQTDFKRMLAYSSIEHMGLITLALGLGGKAVFGVMLHVLGNGLCKGVLFLTAGNIHRAFASKSRESAQGTLKRAPWTGMLFLLGFFAMTGSPPFIPFFSEYAFISSAFQREHHALGIMIVVLLSVAFLGMLLTIIPVVFGDPSPERERTKYRDTSLLIGPPLVLLLIATLLGIWLPEPLLNTLTSAAALLEAPR